MGESGQITKAAARPARAELWVVDLINHLLEADASTICQRMGEVLEHLGVELDLDRVFLFRLRSDGSYYNSHEWVAAAVEPLLAQMQTIPSARHPGWDAAFRAGEIVAIESRTALADGAPERRFLEVIGVQATFMVPLRDAGRLIGVIGCDSMTSGRTWSEEERFLLSSIGRVVAALIQRAEATEAESAARQHLETTLKALPDLVIDIAADGTISACHSDRLPALSAVVRAGMGRPVGTVLPAPLAEVVSEVLAEPPDRRSAKVRQVAVRQVAVRQVGVPQADQTVDWYEISVVPLPFNASLADGALVVVLRDMTASRRASDLASYSEGQFTAFFEMCPHPILLNDFDTGQLLDGNRAFKQVFGFDPKTTVDRMVRDILSADVAWVIDQAAEAMKATGSYGPIEAPLRRADNSRFPALLRGFMSVDPSGRRLVWALIEDITDVRAKEAALQAEGAALVATRTRFLAAIEAIDDGFAIFDANDRLVLWNSRYERVFSGIKDLIREGAVYDDLLRAAISRGVFGAEGERDEAMLSRRLHRPLTEIWDGEDDLADGRVIWVRERATPAHETVGLYEDVTARREAERRLQQVVEGGEVAVWDWDSEAGLSVMNSLGRKMLGMLQENAGFPDLTGLAHHDDLSIVMEVRRALFDGQTDEFDLLCRLRHSDGHWVWTLSRGRVLARRADGSPRRISGVTLDVSARIEAEQRVSRVVSGARVGTWEHDMRTGVTEISDRWAEMLGYSLAELNPLTLDRWLALLHPEDIEPLLQHEADNFAAGRWQIEREIRLRHKRGHWVWVLSRTQAIDWDAFGKPVKTSGVNLDISPAKALESALARERDTLARIMETSVSGIVAVDGAGVVVFANAAAETVLGRPVAPGANLLALLSEARVADLAGTPIPLADLPVSLALAGAGGLYDMRHAIHWPDSGRHVVSVNAARLSGPGTDLAVVCSFTDITVAVENEDRLRAAMTAAEAANRAKSDFLAAMSHEIRTPLNGVLGMANVMLRRTERAEDRGMLQVIHDSGEHLLGVLNDILDLAKIEAGRLVFDLRPLNLCLISSRVIAMHAFKAEEKGLRLTVSRLGGGAADLRLGDEQRVIQILHNLLGNAVKFTEAGEVVLEVDYTFPDRIGIEVRDTGIGMDPEELSHVLDAFTQGRAGSLPRNGGSGLGLAIVQKLARMMQGDVTLSSAPGKGLTARVDLAMPVVAASDHPPAEAELPELPPMRVLAAEDNATNRIILSSMLQSLGVEARIVTSGDEALALWRAGGVDALLFDIAMPGRDGMETLATLQAEASALGRPVPPAIAVTANAMTHQVEAYLKQGFVACVAKPISLTRLAEALLICHADNRSA